MARYDSSHPFDMFDVPGGTIYSGGGGFVFVPDQRIEIAAKVLATMSTQLHMMVSVSLSGITDVHSPLESVGKLEMLFAALQIWTKVSSSLL